MEMALISEEELGGVVDKRDVFYVMSFYSALPLKANLYFYVEYHALL